MLWGLQSCTKETRQTDYDFDLLIGATAMTCNLIMVTENVKHLERIPHLKIENWIDRAKI